MILKDVNAARERIGRFRDLFAAKERIYLAHLDLTYRCDLDCVHCYLDEKNDWPEMKTAEWLSVIDQLGEMGVATVLFSGGEVFARPDFPELLQRTAHHGIRSIVKTHAGNLDAARAKALAVALVDQLDVSVYSLSPDVHDAVTQVPGSLAATLAGIDHALAAGLTVKVNCNVFRANLYELDEMEAYFDARGARSEYNANIYPDLTGAPVPTALVLTEDERLEFERGRLRRQRAKLGRATVVPPAPEPDTPICGAGSTLIYIAPDGAVWPCVTFPMAVGNVREDTLLNIWQSSPELRGVREFKNGKRTQCNSCSGMSVCSYCMGEAYKRTGDYRQAPAAFHDRARAIMVAMNQEQGETFTAAQLQTLPESDADLPAARPKKFAFPIYRPGQSARAKVAVTS